MSFTKSSLTYSLLALAAALTPVLISAALIHLYLGKSVTDFVPTWSDEVSYWHQTLTFAKTGFQGGYYTVSEAPAPAAFTHYYIYGPWYPILYGSIAAVVGWTTYTALFINWAILAGAGALFGLALRLSRTHLLLFAGLMATYWPLQLYLATNMQEALQAANAVVLALIFTVALREQNRLPRRTRCLMVLALTWVSLLRLSWIMLYPPLLLLTAPKSWRGQLLALAQSAACMGLVLWVFQYVGAPGSALFTLFAPLAAFRESVSAGVEATIRYGLANAGRYLDASKQPLDVLQTLQVGLVLAVSLVWLGREAVRRGRHLAGALPLEYAFHLYNLAGIVLAHFILYDVGRWRDYRVIAAHLLLSLLVLLAFKRWRVVGLLIASNLVCIGFFLNTYTGFMRPKLTGDRALTAQTESALHQMIYYDSAAPSGWCNTLLFQVGDYQSFLTGVPAGIGLTFFVQTEDANLHWRSRYVLLRQADYEAVQKLPHPPRLERVGALLNDRQLYLNRDAPCS
jgi:hypothetical protein